MVPDVRAGGIGRTANRAEGGAQLVRKRRQELVTTGEWPDVDLSGTRILVVGDEADGREMLARMLESRGAQVHAAASADEALEALGDDPPDLPSSSATSACCASTATT